MYPQMDLDEFNKRMDKVLAEYPTVQHRAACAAQNAEKSLRECDGYTMAQSAHDYSEQFIYYFACSLAGFTEETN